MTEEKNKDRNDQANPGRKSGSSDSAGSAEKTFIREQIRQNPKRKSSFPKKILLAVILAAVFGAVAAMTFALCGSKLGIFDKMAGESRENVTIPRDQDGISSETSQAESEEQDEKALAESVESLVAKYLKKEKKKESVETLDLVAQVSKINQMLQPSLVTVTSRKADEDVFEHTYVRSQETFGLILAVTSQDIRILTEDYLLEDADSVHITLCDEEVYDANLVGMDAASGFSVVSIPIEGVSQSSLASIKAAELGNSYRLSCGDMLVAVGNPMGYVPSLAWGIVSYIEKGHQGIDGNFQLIQTDIAGDTDAGGLLVNKDGQVVGWITTDDTSLTHPGMLQAISISDLKARIETISNGQEIALLGVKVQAMNTEQTQSSEAQSAAKEQSSSENAAVQSAAENEKAQSAAEKAQSYSEDAIEQSAAEAEKAQTNADVQSSSEDAIEQSSAEAEKAQTNADTQSSSENAKRESAAEAEKAQTNADVQSSLENAKTESAAEAEKAQTNADTQSSSENAAAQSAAETQISAKDPTGISQDPAQTASDLEETQLESGSTVTAASAESELAAETLVSQREESSEMLPAGEIPVGLYITDLLSGGPAYTAGIQNGDILTQIGGYSLSQPEDLEFALASLSPGSSVNVIILRSSRGRYIRKNYTVELAVR